MLMVSTLSFRTALLLIVSILKVKQLIPVNLLSRQVSTDRR